ncbi:aspartyl/glutamyl-tRNA(Asn/Gln) amidotransferase subunit B [Magnaporthiopsis poae ATCC 64411]|uniref:Aspartyl/glutamyl-tRNA(Asn/Gln) amidotransferase subunit B n=1 Tax=Magnaporthiopsis poae (strain ATCC 64411 / 73-15) TaxID=644358 RepID=A0A0C4DW45_MAGP6|nr:aspartyl/glutamyl-tRNA(Asn/Gln) amidotransferase subunit B [Magnaporthiopsis poae ATCC 64411]
MPRTPTTELASYLLAGRLASRGCLRLQSQATRRPAPASLQHALPAQTRRLHASAGIEAPPQPLAPSTHAVPLRKMLKEQAKAAKALNKGKKKQTNADRQTVPGWELTVGIEIHAQLNTSRKLFSPAPIPPASRAPLANTLVAPFDLAVPGTQPVFQPGTLVPAVRAALALNCDVRRVSRFDRKHYFHWDQPTGYQITQYYEPLAVNGYLELRARDGIAPQDIPGDGGGALRVRIKQVQMEQDTAKTLARPDGEGEVDYRYMPDPDLGPIVVGDDVVAHLRDTLGVMPDEEMDDLVASYGLSETDAHALMLLDDGGRLEFYYKVVDALEARIAEASGATSAENAVVVDLQSRILAANWILHVLGSLTSENNVRDRAATGLEPRGLEVTPEGDAFIRPADMADILFFLHSGRIRQGTAKDVLFAVFNGTVPQHYLDDAPDGGGCGIERYIEEKSLWFAELSEDGYVSLAESVLDAEERVLEEFLGGEQYPERKLMFLVGQMMRSEARDRLDPAKVQRVMREVVDKRIACMRP